MWLTSSNSRKAIVAGVLIVFAGMAVVSLISAYRHSTSEAKVVHTYQVMLTVEQLDDSLNDAISMSRAYAITGDRAEIEDLDTRLTSIAALSSRLHDLTLDNSRQQERVAQLKPLIDERLSLLQQSLDLENREPGSRSLQTDLLRKGDSVNSSIQTIIAAIREDERQLLLGRSSASALAESRFLNILLATFVLAGVVLLVLFLVVSAESSRRGRAETTAGESEETFRVMVSAIQDYAILHLDLDGRITTWNLGAERMFGYKSNEILGWPVDSLFQACDRDTPHRHMSTALLDGHVQDDCQKQRRDGTTFWATMNLTLLRDAVGQPRGYALVTRDITERRQQQMEISRREAVLEAFFSNAPVGLAIIGDDLRFQRINGPFSVLNGLSPEHNRGLHVREVTSELATELEPLIQQVISTGVPVLSHEVKGRSPANPNSTGWWLKSFFPLVTDNGRASQIGAVVQDVTALKRAESTVRWLSGRLLQLRDEERRRMARDLHDSLGQVLSAVKMNLSYLSRIPEPLNDRAREAIGESKELIESCIKEVRTLAHLLHPPMLDEVGLLPAIRWFVNGFSQRSGVDVQMDLPATLRRLPAEMEIALFRALQESLTNVHRHSGSHTAAVILNVGANDIQLEVTDQGCGIPSQKLSAARQDQASIGIGILGMRERIRQLGGHLDISSANVGTTVHVRFMIPEAA